MNGQNRWLYLIKRMVYRFFDDGIPQSAAELSYFLLFSMFPLLMMNVSFFILHYFYTIFF